MPPEHKKARHFSMPGFSIIHDLRFPPLTTSSLRDIRVGRIDSDLASSC